jgi:hypothetical protein
MTAPLPTEPLLLKPRLAVWAQQDPLEDEALADAIIDAVSTLLRHYGNDYWTTANLPNRARDIGYFVAKNYYLNPRLLRQETVGPLQESIDARALTGIDLTDEQKAEVASLAGNVVGEVGGLWALQTTRGPVETHRQRRHGTVVVYDTRENGWPIEYLNTEDVVVFTPEGT